MEIICQQAMESTHQPSSSDHEFNSITKLDTMKKFTVLLQVLWFASISFSQTTIKPGVGLNFTDFSKDGGPGGEAQAQVGWQIGGSIAFGTKFYWEPGLFYVGKSTNFTSTSSSTEVETNINGVRVPVAIGYQLLGNQQSTVVLRGFGGLSGFFVTSTENINKDSVNTSNFGLFAGAGLDFWKLFLDVSYEWSLTNIQKDVGAIDVGKSRTLFITAGLRINLATKK